MMSLILKIYSFCLVVLLASESKAFSSEQMEAANRARSSVAMKLHLMATDLLDELAYRFTQNPPLNQPSDVMVMNIVNPMGLNASFGSFLENHLFRLLIHNPSTHMVPVHCPACNVTTAYSTPEGTIIAKGADIPQVSGQQVNAKYALYLDFSIERSHLVLRSRIVALDGRRQIIHAETLSTDSSSPPSLRQPDKLVSTKQAREDYENILLRQDRAKLAFSTRITMFEFEDSEIIIPPLPWVLVGTDIYPSERRDWYLNLSAGVASLPGEVNGAMLTSRYGTRLIPEYTNLIQPEVFGYIGFDYFELKGNMGRTMIASGKKTTGEFRSAILEEESEDKFSTTSLNLGVELQLSRMTRIGVFVGRMMQIRDTELFGNDYHYYGVEMGVSL